MADNLPDVIENQLLDALVGTAAYTMTGPVKLRLMSISGTDAAAGTEVTGGSYVSQTITFGAAALGVIANSATINFAGLPATTVNGVEWWDSNATPKRLAYGVLTIPKTTTAGDTLQFAAGSITLSLA
jgi:hypothetical protein